MTSWQAGAEAQHVTRTLPADDANESRCAREDKKPDAPTSYSPAAEGGRVQFELGLAEPQMCALRIGRSWVLLFEDLE